MQTRNNFYIDKVNFFICLKKCCLIKTAITTGLLHNIGIITEVHMSHITDDRNTVVTDFNLTGQIHNRNSKT